MRSWQAMQTRRTDPSNDPRGLRNPVTYVAIAVLVILPMLLLLSACARPAAQPADPPAPSVTVAEVVSREVTEWDEVTGRLEAVNTVAVRPRVSGFVAAARFEEGAIVRRGNLLFQIDPRPFEAEADRLRAELARARATVQRATSELQRAGRLAGENGEPPSRRSRPLKSRQSRPRCVRPS
jgi:multidrug efflux pump subunit AcrA (membrane-fusion protein)